MMKCPRCQGLVMGLESSELENSEDFKCLNCKITFTIWEDKESNVSVPQRCFGCKSLKDDVCWYDGDLYEDFMFDVEDCYEVSK